MTTPAQDDGWTPTKILSLIIVVGAALFAVASILPILFKHSGPTRLYSLGYVRFSSCTYKGEFIGGVGFDCVAKNYAQETRRPQMSCGSYDDQDRLIGQLATISALTHTLLSPGEERIIRIYGEEGGALLVCSENGDIPSRPLRTIFDELAREGLANELSL